MNKKLLGAAVIAWLTVLGSVFAQAPIVTIYSENFQNGKPSDMTYIDGDGLTLTDNLKGTGLECGTWHIVRNDYTDENLFMASTSSFTSPGKANDWMITPAVKINRTGSTLSWKSMSLSKLKKDGLKVYVSTRGNRIEDFDSEPLFSIEAESGDGWQTHEVSLDPYAGEIIYVAFVNDSYNKYVLCIDDIKIAGPAADASFRITTPLMTDTGNTQMSFEVTNHYADPINACTIYYNVDGRNYTETFNNLNLTKGETTLLTAKETIEVPVNTTIHYEGWIEMGGSEYLPQSGTTCGTYFISKRRTLIEKSTGIWCSSCPGAAVAMEYLEKNYPDRFVHIDIHGAQDPMAMESYINFMGVTTYPTLLTDRKFMHNPVGIDESGLHFSLMLGAEKFFLQAQGEMAQAEINGTAKLVDPTTNRIDIEVTTRFTNDFDNHAFDIALILLEDSVTATNGSLYRQTNGYSSTVYRDVTIYGLKDTLEAFGGWAYQPTAVPMKFNHVARAAYENSFDGLEVDDQLPEQLKGNVSYTSKYSWEIPQGVVNNINHTAIVAVLTDINGQVTNVCKMYVTPDASHIDKATISCESQPTAIYTPSGTRVSELQKGVNIVEYRDATGKRFTRKVVK